ncbi:MAG: hypothetical protein M0R66_06555 [Candidatus Omnitrophica bacterium]|jgi:DNA-directed RNA polymerase subunit N (RpoN/RPB10)|nr:hypothetical protein [Candidatus Omnitrophota bacterium]
MYPNIVCFCGCPLGHLYNAFRAACIKHRAGPHAREPIGYILDDLGITKDCCRARMMTNMEFKSFYYVPDPSGLAPTLPIARAIAPEAPKAKKRAAKGKAPRD